MVTQDALQYLARDTKMTMTKTDNHSLINSCPRYHCNAHVYVFYHDSGHIYMWLLENPLWLITWPVFLSVPWHPRVQFSVSCLWGDKALFSGMEKIKACTTVMSVLNAEKGPLLLVSHIGWKEGKAASSKSSQEMPTLYGRAQGLLRASAGVGQCVKT